MLGVRLATATGVGTCSALTIGSDEMIRVMHEEHAFSDLFLLFLRGRYETRGSNRSGKGLTIRLTDLRIFDPQIVWPFYLA